MAITRRGKTYEEYFGSERAELEKRKRGKGKTYEEMYGPEKAARLKQLRAKQFRLNQREQFRAMAKERWANDEAYRQMMVEVGMAYNSVGWECLVIWEHELENMSEEEVLKKITNFFKRR